ncbi:PTS sugar transporter subunit IIA [Aeromicrobium camelliae]|uniref:PTS sugar transporter subunit IIA n=1 Tax=Aeromicrobium camelliae TaxID=1538144 RepID=A0A3N6X5A1_9ACTN|nr:PTS sugar transporter subunit IIA [Aeromicrobium camelliae]RQN09295.1 PTS sugar transporter subunit IIA [Aeromicrobium camelliae]
MEIFTQENVRFGGAPATKDEALSSIAEFAVELGYAADVDGVVAGLKAREEEMSTALMDGIAIPHTKHAAVEQAALLVRRFDQPVDWSGQEVTVTLVMLVPEAEAGTTHLTLLAQVSRALIDEELRRILATGSRDEVHSALNAKLG